jgi:iron(III) transport system permease protein
VTTKAPPISPNTSPAQGEVSGPLSRSPWLTVENLLIAALLLVVGYLIIPPFGVLVFGSITDSKPAAPPHFTLATIEAAFSRGVIYPALLNSFIFAALTATIVLIMGAFLAWLVTRTDSVVRHMTDLFALAPILLPSVLQVSGWIMLLGPRNGMINLFAMEYLGFSSPPFNLYSFAGMVWVSVLQELPLAFLWLWPAFRAMNPELEEAALVGGGSMLTVLRRVTLPMLRPTLFAAWIIFFIYAFGALSVPLLIGLPSRIFLYSTEIYLATTRFPTNLNVASAYSLLFVAITFFGIYAYRRATADASRFVTVTGRAYNPRLIPLGLWQIPITALAILMLLLVAGLPLLVLVWNAFMPYPQVPSFKSLEVITMANFNAALNYGPAMRAIGNSLMLGLGAGILATLIGGAIAWTTLRLKAKGRMVGLLEQLAMTPIAVPGMITGVGLLWLYLVLPLPIYGTPWILLIAYVTILLPFAVRICSSGLTQIHQELEEASAVAGASLFTTLRRVVLLLIAPSAIASVLYVALRAFREYSASIFLTAPGNEVVSVLVLDMWNGGNANTLAAYVTMVTALLTVAIVFVQWVGRRTGIQV